MTYDANSVIEFQPWPKIPRLNRDILISEKIDGSNAAVIVVDSPFGHAVAPGERANGGIIVNIGQGPSEWDPVWVGAQSRKKLISPGKSTDNFGFAAWVRENAELLAMGLGRGHHFGEWYGKGIQRGYGLDHRRFALFNCSRWNAENTAFLPDLDVVPILWGPGRFSTDAITVAIMGLKQEGSALVPGFDRPEGVVVFHTASGHAYKVLVEGDELPKGVTTRQERDIQAEIIQPLRGLIES